MHPCPFNSHGETRLTGHTQIAETGIVSLEEGICCCFHSNKHKLLTDLEPEGFFLLNLPCH